MAATDPVHDHISDILSWFQKLEQQIPIPHTPAGKRLSRYNVAQTQKWLTEAQAALAAVFPVDHNCRRDWLMAEPKTLMETMFGGKPSQTFGVFRAAHQLLKDGRLGSLIDRIRAIPRTKLLDQAGKLLEDGYLAAATVIAGGALETHLPIWSPAMGVPKAVPERSASIAKPFATLVTARRRFFPLRMTSRLRPGETYATRPLTSRPSLRQTRDNSIS